MPEFILERVESAAETAAEIGMDSGVVDLVKALPNWSGAQDENTADGLLYQTTFVSSYLSTAPVNDDSPVVNIIPPPNTGGTPEASGATAKSFRKKKSTDYTALYNRKRAAVLCPPSIFTGKTRLYVQAIYGLHDVLANVSATLAATEVLARPSIYVSGAEIHTSCGVFLDPATGKHYLLSVEGAQTKIYRMTATTAAEKLRSKLIDATISEAEREKIEAFVLAYSSPSSLIQTLQNGVSYTESMGYGWHFNWSGTTCDIVINSVVFSASGGQENESTHHRLTFSFYNGAFSVSHSIVEGPVRWKSQRHAHVICSPVWYEMLGLEKFGAHYGPQPFGDAPFYVFYKRDDVQVCRYKAASQAVAKGADRTPDYLNPGARWTRASDEMDYEYWTDWAGVRVSISCGTTTLAEVSGTRSSTVLRKSPVTYEMPALNSMSWYKSSMATFGTYNYPSGQYSPVLPQSAISNQYEGTITVYSGGGVQNGAAEQISYTYPTDVAWTQFDSISGPVCNWTTYTGARSTLYSVAFIAAIPFYDAEAICMMSSMTTSVTETGTKYDKTGGGWFKCWAAGGLYEEFPSLLISVNELMNFDTGTTVSSEAYTEEKTPVTVTNSQFVGSSASKTGIDIPLPGAFFNSFNEIVPVVIDVRASCNGAVFSSQLSVDVANGTILKDKPFVFTGWA